MRSLSELSLVLAVVGCAAPPAASVSGLVWVGEEPGEGAEVTLVGPVTRVLVVDERGEWLARGLPEGDYAVTAKAASTLEAEVTSTVQVAGVSTCEALRLTPVGIVSGRLVGEGATGATVAVSGGLGLQTGADGEFRLGRVPAGEREVVLWAPGFATVRARVVVRRGEEVTLAPVTLQRLEQHQGPQVATLAGQVWVPGSDEAGVTVSIEGTPLVAITTADGRFRFDDVPAGTVSLRFERAPFGARLARVLVVPGTSGFVIDTELEALDARPVMLDRGVTVATGDFQLLGAHQGWVAWAEREKAVWLRSPQGVNHLVVEGSYREFRGFRGGDFWAMAEDRFRRLTVVRFELARLVSHRFENVGREAKVLGDGLVWRDGNTLTLRTGETDLSRYDFEAGDVHPLADGAAGALVLLRTGLNDGFVVRLGPDGAERNRVRITGGHDTFFAVSRDERWAVLGFRQSSTTSVLVNLSTGATRPMAACWSPSFSPESTRLWCGGALHDLTTSTFEQVLTPDTYVPWSPVWLANGAVALLSYRLHLFRPGQALLEVPGTDPFEPLFVTSTGRLRLVGRVEASTGLGQALEVSPADGTVTVLADEVEPSVFAATDHGVLVARPRALGGDLQLSLVRATGAEVPVGRWLRFKTLSTSQDGRFISGRRVVPGRGIEIWALDVVNGQVFPVAFGRGGLWDGRRLVYVNDSTKTPGLAVTEFP